MVKQAAPAPRPIPAPRPAAKRVSGVADGMVRSRSAASTNAAKVAAAKAAPAAPKAPAPKAATPKAPALKVARPVAPTAKPQPVKSQPTKQPQPSTQRLVAQPPAKRPLGQGRMIDFAPRRSQGAKATPAPVRVASRAATPQAAPAPRPQARPATNSTAPKPTARTVQVTHAAQPQMAKPKRRYLSTDQPAMRAARPNAHISRQATVGDAIAAARSTQVTKVQTTKVHTSPKPTSTDNDIDAIETSIGEFIKDSKEDTLTIESLTSTTVQEEFVSASDPAAYSAALSDMSATPKKSPFLESVQVDKRPLSARRPDGKNRLEGLPRKNVYERRTSESVASAPAETVVSKSKRSSNISLAIAIILTIMLGAGVGAVIYLLVFQS